MSDNYDGLICATCKAEVGACDCRNFTRTVYFAQEQAQAIRHNDFLTEAEKEREIRDLAAQCGVALQTNPDPHIALSGEVGGTKSVFNLNQRDRWFSDLIDRIEREVRVM